MPGVGRRTRESVERVRVGSGDHVVVGGERLAVLVVDAREQLRGRGLVRIPVTHVLDQSATLLLRGFTGRDGALPLVAPADRRGSDGRDATPQSQDVVAQEAGVAVFDHRQGAQLGGHVGIAGLVGVAAQAGCLGHLGLVVVHQIGDEFPWGPISAKEP